MDDYKKIKGGEMVTKMVSKDARRHSDHFDRKIIQIKTVLNKLRSNIPKNKKKMKQKKKKNVS
jgi:hypothetical protein